MDYQEWIEGNILYRKVMNVSFLGRLCILFLGRLCCGFEIEQEPDHAE